MTIDAAIDPMALRRAMGRFATGVTIITTVDGDGRPVGCTMNAFTSLSMEPPLVLICIGNQREMAAHLQAGSGFVVNVLASDQAELALTFARPSDDRFQGLAWRPGFQGMPNLPGAICHVECSSWSVVDGGDHQIVIGHVENLEIHEGQPLLFSDGAFLSLPSSAPVQADVHDEWLVSAPW